MLDLQENFLFSFEVFRRLEERSESDYAFLFSVESFLRLYAALCLDSACRAFYSLLRVPSQISSPKAMEKAIDAFYSLLRVPTGGYPGEAGGGAAHFLFSVEVFSPLQHLSQQLRVQRTFYSLLRFSRRASRPLTLHSLLVFLFSFEVFLAAG